jgi:alkanesulfonate monooxygenase SsuD/methylene tetrahydromethanopterin reductase-like flavin-dependent oxidoreductase (luciferase family)
MQERPVQELLGWATRFDEAGIDSLWIADYLALPQDVDHRWYAGWNLLAALAGVTARCRIGPLVTTFPYHSSLAMARHVVTIDALSDGWLDLGIGIGGAPVDRAFGGLPDASFGELAETLDRGLTATLALLDGHRLPVPAAPVLKERPGPADIALGTPYPQFGRLPIVAGGHSPRSLDVAAKHAHRWNTFGSRPGPAMSSRRSIERATSSPNAAWPSAEIRPKSPDPSCRTSIHRSQRTALMS